MFWPTPCWCYFWSLHLGNQVLLLFNYITSRHPNIRFTMEKEIDYKIPFLVVLINNDTYFPVTSVYHKKTFMGLLTNYFSLYPIPTNWVSFALLLTEPTRSTTLGWVFTRTSQKLPKLLTRTSYSPSSWNINRYLTFTHHDCTPLASVSDTALTFYFTSPDIGPFCIIMQKKVRHYAKRYCNKIDIKIVFSSFKIGKIFSVKDPVPCALRAGVADLEHF